MKITLDELRRIVRESFEDEDSYDVGPVRDAVEDFINVMPDEARVDDAEEQHDDYSTFTVTMKLSFSRAYAARLIGRQSRRGNVQHQEMMLTACKDLIGDALEEIGFNDGARQTDGTTVTVDVSSIRADMTMTDPRINIIVFFAIGE